MTPGSPPTIQRLGIYGGTFDPPHLGHLILAEAAADFLALDQVLFVPAAHPPHKPPATVRAAAHHRLAMVEHAVADNVRFGVSRVDIDRPGPHYTVDTLARLHESYPQATLFFLIGADSLHDLPRWLCPARLLELATLGVMRRPGSQPNLDALEAALPGITARVQWIDAPLIDISASNLAAHIAAGYSVRYRIPDAVCEYISKHNLYRKAYDR